MSKSPNKNADIRLFAVIISIFIDIILGPTAFYRWFVWAWDGHYHPERARYYLLHFLLILLAMLLPWIVCGWLFHKYPMKKSQTKSSVWLRP